MKITQKFQTGFTLIELLVVIAIVGLLASVIMVAMNNARIKARDAKRLADIKQILTALAVYYDKNNAYPGNTDNDYGGWDTGYNGGPTSNDPFIQDLVTDGIMARVPGDPKTSLNSEGYRYYRYPAGDYSCDANRGTYFVLGIYDLEGTSGTHPNSPGWSCPGRNWQGEFEWVTGAFER